MSWTILEPVPVRSKHSRPVINAKLFLLSDGSQKVQLFLSRAFMQDYPGHTKADVYFGQEADAGRAKIAFTMNGKFELSGNVDRGLRISIPAPKGAPRKTTENLPCEVIEKSAVEIVIQLPAWVRPAAPVTTEPPAPKPVGRPAGLNAKQYLESRGHTVERLTTGGYMLDGETVTKGKVCLVINEHRKKADLDPIAPEGFF